MDEKLFKSKMKECSIAFNQEISKAKLALYWKNLSIRYTDEQFRNKIDNILNYNDRFPLIAEIHKASENFNRRDVNESTGFLKKQNRNTGK